MSRSIFRIFALAGLFTAVTCADVLASSGFTNCLDNPTVKVNHANITFNKDTGTVVFDAAGSSSQEQKVKATLVVTAYGQQVFQKSFDPCDNSTLVKQLCPVPKGDFAATGTQQIPSDYLAKIPAIAFAVPDIDADAQLHLVSLDTGKEVACVKSGVTNGKSVQLPAIGAISGAILGASLLLAGIGALANAGSVGSASPSPSFSAVFLWFQSMAQNGMLSVNYPPVYRSFTKNFGFSAGVIQWDSLQTGIDNFRSATGGNLTEDNVGYLRNATLVFTDGEHNTTTFSRRDFISRYADEVTIFVRDLSTSVNSTSSGTADSSPQHVVSGIRAYVEKLSVPQSNTFMTVLLVFAIVVAAIIVGILGFKLILEVWALFASFPKRLTGFRERYWRTIAQTLTTLILLLYGIWTIWCIFQFTVADSSWPARTLAAVTWAIFTAVLAFYTIKIFLVVRKLRKQEGDTSALYEDQETWQKYSFMYDSYKKGYWWIFVPVIIYMFAKGVVIAAGNGHGMTQTAAQLVIESVMFIFLLWTRPFATKGSNWINNSIQFVRVLSIICILVFVEQLHIAQTTKTVTGVVLIAVQVGLTAILGILLIVNAIRVCFKTNPHAKKLKEAKERQEQLEKGEGSQDFGAEPKTPLMRDFSPVSYDRQPQADAEQHTTSSTNLAHDAAPMGRYSSRKDGQGFEPTAGSADRSEFDSRMSRQPTLPAFDSSIQARPPYRAGHY